MKTFLEVWITEAASLLTRELGVSISIEAGGVLPAADQCVSFEARFVGDSVGRLLVAVDKQDLAALLLETQVTDDQPDLERDRSLWRGMLLESLTAASKSFRDDTDTAEPASLKDTAEMDKFALPFLMKYGQRTLRMAIADHIKPPEQAPSPSARAVSDVPPPNVDSASRSSGRMDLLLDIELEASLRFGSCEMPLKEVLELGPGDVIQLDRHVTDPVDLIVGDKIVARGEVVLVNGNFGLRVLEVAEPRRCLESIRCLF